MYIVHNNFQNLSTDATFIFSLIEWIAKISGAIFTAETIEGHFSSKIDASRPPGVDIIFIFLPENNL